MTLREVTRQLREFRTKGLVEELRGCSWYGGRVHRYCMTLIMGVCGNVSKVRMTMKNEENSEKSGN